MKKVSIIMGVFNGADRVENAVQSLLSQTYSDFEIIICDDCSSDDTFPVLQKLAQKDNRIKIIRNSENQKLAATLNHCIGYADGEYIARMDDDDYSHPERLAEQVGFLDYHPEYAIVGTGCSYFDENGIWGKNIFLKKPEVQDIFRGRSFCHPTVMMRKAALDDVRGYTVSKENVRSQDFDLWCKLYSKGHKGYNLPRILFSYYEAPESVLRRKKIYRYDLLKKRLYWRGKLGLNYCYVLFAFLDFFKIIVPNKVILLIHKRNYNKKIRSGL